MPKLIKIAFIADFVLGAIYLIFITNLETFGIPPQDHEQATIMAVIGLVAINFALVGLAFTKSGKPAMMNILAAGGKVAKAKVLSISEGKSKSSIHLDVEVRPQDQSTFLASFDAPLWPMQTFTVGDDISVIFDPNDHSKVVPSWKKN